MLETYWLLFKWLTIKKGDEQRAPADQKGDISTAFFVIDNKASKQFYFYPNFTLTITDIYHHVNIIKQQEIWLVFITISPYNTQLPECSHLSTNITQKVRKLNKKRSDLSKESSMFKIMIWKWMRQYFNFIQ